MMDDPQPGLDSVQGSLAAKAARSPGMVAEQAYRDKMTNSYEDTVNFPFSKIMILTENRQVTIKCLL